MSEVRVSQLKRWILMCLAAGALLWLLLAKPIETQQLQSLHTAQIYAFGTLIDLSFFGESQANAQSAAEKLEQFFNQQHTRWHAWRPSVLTRFNDACQSQQPFAVDTRSLDLLGLAKTLSEETKGFFNPSIGGLVALWGFHSDTPKKPRTPPAEAVIDRYQQNRPSMDDIVIKANNEIVCTNPQVQLDFGGFAKGYGVGEAIKLLDGVGIKNAIVNAGGDLKVLGQKSEQLWRVAIKNPSKEGMLAILHANRGESVFTSGSYDRFFIYQGQRHSHVLNPFTGRPAKGLTGVTVVTDDAARADAYATALLAAGPKKARQLLQSLPITGAIMVTDSEQVIASQSLKSRLDWQTPQQKVLWID